jgi:hypothetical protein
MNVREEIEFLFFFFVISFQRKRRMDQRIRSTNISSIPRAYFVAAGTACTDLSPLSLTDQKLQAPSALAFGLRSCLAERLALSLPVPRDSLSSASLA